MPSAPGRLSLMRTLPWVRRHAKAVLGCILCLLGMVLTAQLGAWQLRRAAEQDQRAAQMQRNAQQPVLQHLPCHHKPLPYQPVRVRGHFLPNTLVYIDNRQVQGHPAVQVVQAFVVAGAACVVAVDRGYVLRNPAAPRALPAPPAATQGTQPVELQAWVVPALQQSAELPSWFHGTAAHQIQEQGQWLWSNVQHASYAQHLHQQGTALPLVEFFLTEQPLSEKNSVAQQANRADEATVAVPTPNAFWHQPLLLPHKAGKHRAYAAQWYGLCVVLGVALIVLAFKKCFQVRYRF